MTYSGIPANETQLAVLAIEIHDLFLGQDEDTGRTIVVEADPAVVQAALRCRD